MLHGSSVVLFMSVLELESNEHLEYVREASTIHLVEWKILEHKVVEHTVL